LRSFSLLNVQHLWLAIKIAPADIAKSPYGDWCQPAQAGFALPLLRLESPKKSCTLGSPLNLLPRPCLTGQGVRAQTVVEGRDRVW
jgi:hypothetical protein